VAITHQVTVALLDNVAEMNSDTKIDAPLRRQTRIAFDHAILHFDRTAHCVDHAAKLNQCAVASAFHDASALNGYRRIEQIAPERPEPGKCTIFIRTCEAAVSDDIGRQYRRDFSLIAHAVGTLPRDKRARVGMHRQVKKCK
jgi:hypothetical protein